jgi:hypothetical protein
MPRTFVVKKKTDFDTLAGTIIDSRVREAQASEALTRLREANPHVGKDLPAGTVLLIPDAPGLKASAGDRASKAPADSLRAFVARALEETTQRSRARLAERSASRTELAKAINSAGFKRAAAASQVSVEPFLEAAKALAKDDKKDQEAAEGLAAMSSAALAALARLDEVDR